MRSGKVSHTRGLVSYNRLTYKSHSVIVIPEIASLHRAGNLEEALYKRWSMCKCTKKYGGRGAHKSSKGGEEGGERHFQGKMQAQDTLGCFIVWLRRNRRRRGSITFFWTDLSLFLFFLLDWYTQSDRAAGGDIETVRDVSRSSLDPCYHRLHSRCQRGVARRLKCQPNQHRPPAPPPTYPPVVRYASLTASAHALQEIATLYTHNTMTDQTGFQLNLLNCPNSSTLQVYQIYIYFFFYINIYIYMYINLRSLYIYIKYIYIYI